jgi:hypothetical protein
MVPHVQTTMQSTSLQAMPQDVHGLWPAYHLDAFTNSNGTYLCILCAVLDVVPDDGHILEICKQKT